MTETSVRLSCNGFLLITAERAPESSPWFNLNSTKTKKMELNQMKIIGFCFKLVDL